MQKCFCLLNISCLPFLKITPHTSQPNPWVPFSWNFSVGGPCVYPSSMTASLSHMKTLFPPHLEGYRDPKGGGNHSKANYYLATFLNFFNIVKYPLTVTSSLIQNISKAALIVATINLISSPPLWIGVFPLNFTELA